MSMRDSPDENAWLCVYGTCPQSFCVCVCVCVCGSNTPILTHKSILNSKINWILKVSSGVSFHCKYTQRVLAKQENV